MKRIFSLIIASVIIFGLTIISLCLLPNNGRGEPITDPSQLIGKPKLIDFEEFDTGGNMLTMLPNPVIFRGVTFTCLTGIPYIFDISLAGWPQLTQVESKTMFPGESEPDSAISISFQRPVFEVLLGWGDPSYPGNFLLAFDADGNLLESIEVPIGRAAWVGFKRETADIAMVRAQPNQLYPNGDDYVIDNIYYNFKPVPEPATMLLLGSGLLGLWGLRRKFKK